MGRRDNLATVKADPSQQNLLQSEEQFRMLVEAVRDYAIFRLDPDGYVASWNTGAQRIKGYSADDIIGKHFSVFYPEERVRSGWPEEELRRALKDGSFEDEGWRVRKDGTRFWANVVITALFDNTGQHRGYAKVTRDLTERRQLERIRAEALSLTDVSRRKDEFLAMLSHELRNPLSPILSAVHLLRREQTATPIQEQAVSVINRQVTNLSRLIDDLLEVSRITSGRIRLKQEETDFRTAIWHAIETAKPNADDRNIRISVDLPDSPVWLKADATRIEQVVINLLMNSVKYSQEGGSVWVTLKNAGTEAVLRVRDAGIGIASELLPYVFDLFMQADRSLARSQGGLGIGLTIVHKIVELHGGKVEAISEGPGKGSEFVVRIPTTSATVIHTSQPTRVRHPDEAATLRVLVVDDNRDAADTAAVLLRTLGHEVQVAYSGKSALHLAMHYQPNVAVLDIGLPEMDGYEIARRLRQNPDFKNLVLIALSGYGKDSDKKLSKAAGFDAHLIKPVEFEKIEEIFQDLRKAPAR